MWYHGTRNIQGPRRSRLATLVVVLILGASGCSMSEEVKRIEQVKQLQQRQAAANSTDLTGEQIFIRSCNSCHVGGRKGMGPALERLNEKFPDDQMLKNLIRKGRGIMPAQTKQTLNDRELDNLVAYLRTLN